MSTEDIHFKYPLPCWYIQKNTLQRYVERIGANLSGNTVW